MSQGEHGDGDERASRPQQPRRSERELGRYRIEGLIGHGGMASVHRAYDLVRGHSVALKRLELPAAVTDRQPPHEAARRRAQLTALFQHEYRTLAQLAHPSIVGVYDYGVSNGRPYFTMELLTGRDLGRSVRLSWQQVSTIMCDVASALTLLHARRLLHRDVTPRNVHYSDQGRAKLLDFGAMSGMGVCELLVGTPAFVAPEVVKRQFLDARCDLYALGAVGYTLLTGKPPYVAQTFKALAEAQRSAVPAPSSLVADVSKPLENLIMQLIQLERDARPSSAVEVVERLRALTGTPYDAQMTVASAYLSAPSLVGRETQLSAIRRRALRAQRNKGVSLQVVGVPGSGRTRLLDECALEGRLAGALVLRACPDAQGASAFAAVRSVLLQLQAALSERERALSPQPAIVQEQLLPDLQWQVAQAARPSSPPPRLAAGNSPDLARACYSYLFELTRVRSLMLLVDDFERIDPHSAALFAGLAQAAGSSRLVLITANTPEGFESPEPAQHILRQHSLQLPLALLSASETHALLRSICGDVPNLQLLADRLHALGGGSPKLGMELMHHLIERHVVRYEAGGFVLPQSLSAQDLPSSLDQVLRARFAQLSGPARELGTCLALCAGTPLSIAQCLQLTAADAPELAQRAFSELNRAELLQLRAGCVTLRQHAFGAALLADVDAAGQRILHARLADLLKAEPTQHIAAAEHYLLADQPNAALDLLLPAAENDTLFQEWFGRFDSLLRTALSACEQLGRPARHAFMLRRARARHRLHFIAPGESAELVAYARELEPLTGLSQYHALDPALDAGERLKLALTAAQTRYECTPERERLYAPLEALTELAMYTAALAGYAVSTSDHALRAQLTSLEPFVPLSPAILFTHKTCRAFTDVREGRHGAYYAALDELLGHLERPDRGGLPERSHLRARLGVLYMLAMADAALGRAAAFERADELEADAQTRALAWRIRHLAHLYRGDLQRARACQREYEWLTLQEGYHHRYQNSSLDAEFLFYARIDDLLGLRRMLPELERMGELYPGWQAFMWLARGELERVRGNYDLALSHNERALSLTRPGKHDTWAYAAALQVRVLVDAQRAQEALKFGREACAHMQEHGLEVICAALTSAVAQALSALGDHRAAIAHVDGLLGQRARLRASGMYAGLWCEERARLALRVGDGAGFWRWYRDCVTHFGDAAESPFAPRIARLLHEERELRGAGVRAPCAKNDREHASMRTRRELTACANLEERAQLGLSKLLELTASDAGQLFGVCGHRLLPLATLGPAADSGSLAQRLEGHLARNELGRPEDTPVIDAQGEVLTSQVLAITDEYGMPYRAVAICNASDAIVALAAFNGRTILLSMDVIELLATLGDVLFDKRDVEALEAEPW